MKITYNLKEPKTFIEKMFAATWTYGVPLFFLTTAGIIREPPLSLFFFIVGALPLFVRFEL